MKNTVVSIPIANLNSTYEVITARLHSANFSPMHSDIKKNQLCSLDAEQLRTCFNITLDALDDTLNFITDQYLSTPSRIDYVTYLTGFFVFNNLKTLNAEDFGLLCQWYREIFSGLSSFKK